MRKLIILVFVAILLMFYTYTPDRAGDINSAVYLNQEIRRSITGGGMQIGALTGSKIQANDSTPLAKGVDSHYSTEISTTEREDILSNAPLTKTYSMVANKGSKSTTEPKWAHFYRGDRITLPLNPADGVTITDRPTSAGGRSGHAGYDLAAAAGTPVYSALDGRVIYSQTHKSVRNVSGAFGNTVIVASQMSSGEWIQIIYPHLQKKSPLKVGDKVVRGQQIGVVGSTGNSTGNHLHFEARNSNSPMSGTNVDIFLNIYGYNGRSLAELKNKTGYK